jgi:hypothetical protein
MQPQKPKLSLVIGVGACALNQKQVSQSSVLEPPVASSFISTFLYLIAGVAIVLRRDFRCASPVGYVALQ